MEWYIENCLAIGTTRIGPALIGRNVKRVFTTKTGNLDGHYILGFNVIGRLREQIRWRGVGYCDLWRW